jgi:hypothetical protein
MIQQADVGVGVKMRSDYAIVQFRYIGRLDFYRSRFSTFYFDEKSETDLKQFDFMTSLSRSR